jgi:hypothetical protein
METNRILSYKTFENIVKCILSGKMDHHFYLSKSSERAWKHEWLYKAQLFCINSPRYQQCNQFDINNNNNNN